MSTLGTWYGGVVMGVLLPFNEAAILYRHFNCAPLQKQKIIVFAANNSRCCECHVAPTIILCFGLVAPTIILNKVHILYIYCTYTVPQCLSPSLELGPPTPSPANECAPPPKSQKMRENALLYTLAAPTSRR